MVYCGIVGRKLLKEKVSSLFCILRPGLQCRILHAPNQIAELSTCKMRRLKQFELNASSVEYSTVPVSSPFIAVLCGTTT